MALHFIKKAYNISLWFTQMDKKTDKTVADSTENIAAAVVDSIDKTGGEGEENIAAADPNDTEEENDGLTVEDRAFLNGRCPGRGIKPALFEFQQMITGRTSILGWNRCNRPGRAFGCGGRGFCCRHPFGRNVCYRRSYLRTYCARLIAI